MEIKDFIKTVAKVLNVKEPVVQAYIDAEDEDEAKEAIIELNIANLKKKFGEGYKKAEKLAVKEVVEALKTEFGVDIAGESAETIVNSLKEGLGSKDAADISEETIKSSAPYKQLLTESTREKQERLTLVEKEVKKQLKDKEKEFNEGLKKAKRSSIDSEVEIEAERWLTEQKAILPTDPAKKKLFIKDFARKLAADEIEKDEEGNYLISQNGTPLTNKDGHNATLSDRFSQYDYMFHRQEVQQRQSSGLPQDGGGQGGGSGFKHFKGDVPKNEAEMNKLRMDYSNDKLSKDAYKEVDAAYKAAQTA